MKRKFLVKGLSLLIIGMGLTACVGEIERPVFPAENAVEPPEAQRYSAARNYFQGQQRFLWDAWGTERLDLHPPASFFLDLMQDEPEVFGNQFASFGFIPDPNDDFPVGFKRGLTDNTKVHETCALCHVAELPDGRLWLGAPNTALEFNRFRREVNERWVAQGNPSLMSDLQIEKSYVLGPGRTSSESDSSETVIGSDFPPYLNLAQRKHFNYTGTGRAARTECAFAIFTMGAGKRGGVNYPFDFIVNQQLATFIASLNSPEAPPQDIAKVEQGRQVFQEAQCGKCHHIENLGLDPIVQYDDSIPGLERIPGEDPNFPRGSIQTDRMRFDLQDTALDSDGYLEMIVFVVTKFLAVGTTDGYRPSDLRTLWATAPYLHNGSVPTLRDLLNPAAERPEVFERFGFTYDTLMPGNGNQGHEFGVELSDEDKDALVVYLKSL